MSTAQRDFYEILSVPRTASPDEIKRAYRRLAMKLHPDVNPGDAAAEERFKEATEAYSVLSDPDKRARYDRFGFDAIRGRGRGGAASVDVADLSDLFDGIFSDIFGSQPRRRRGAGRDVRADVEIAFEEAAFGCDRTIQIQRYAACDVCRGSGARAGTTAQTCGACRGAGEVRFRQGVFALRRPCSGCAGTGRVVVEPCPSCIGQGRKRRTDEVKISFAPGSESGEVLKVGSLGDVGPNDGPAGDLHVHVRVREHPFFVRDGDDVRCTVPVSFPTAALGSLIEVPTLDGKVKMRIPAGTQPGHVLRLRGKGVVRRGGRRRGDQLVTVLVEVPQNLSKRQRELMTDLSKELGEEAHPQRRTFLEKLKGFLGG